MTLKTNMLGEFTDLSMENRYITYYLNDTKQYSRICILLTGIVYFSMFLFDYYNFSDLMFSFLARSFVLLYAVFLFFYIKKSNAIRKHLVLVTLYGCSFTISFLLILCWNDAQSYVDQSMGIMVNIFTVFLIPNRWVLSLSAAFFSAISFLVISFFYIDSISTYYQVLAIICLSLTILSTSIAFYHMAVFRRKQFLKEHQLQLLSSTDKLTKIFNRQKFDAVLDEWISLAHCQQASFSLIMFDLDNFKDINDRHGHLIGDHVLYECASLIQSSIRENDIFARWGGEEFMILLPNTTLSSAYELTSRICEMISGHVFRKEIHITASFGVTKYRPHDTPTSIIKRVDQLMYQAKLNGKNCVQTDKGYSGRAAQPLPKAKA